MNIHAVIRTDGEFASLERVLECFEGADIALKSLCVLCPSENAAEETTALLSKRLSNTGLLETASAFHCLREAEWQGVQQEGASSFLEFTPSASEADWVFYFDAEVTPALFSLPRFLRDFRELGADFVFTAAPFHGRAALSFPPGLQACRGLFEESAAPLLFPLSVRDSEEETSEPLPPIWLARIENLKGTKPAPELEWRADLTQGLFSQRASWFTADEAASAQQMLSEQLEARIVDAGAQGSVGAAGEWSLALPVVEREVIEAGASCTAASEQADRLAALVAALVVPGSRGERLDLAVVINAEELESKSSFYGFPCLSLSEALKLPLSKGEAVVFPTCVSTTAAAHTMRYVLGAEVCQFVAENEQKTLVARERVSAREWAYAGLAAALVGPIVGNAELQKTLSDSGILPASTLVLDTFPSLSVTQGIPFEKEAEPSGESLVTFLSQQYEEPKKATSGEEAPALTVILPVHNALDAVRFCLSSLDGNLSENTKVIVVDDKSDKGTAQYLRSFCRGRKETFTLLSLKENQGFISACQHGFEAADSSSDILLLNSDVVLSEGSLRRIQQAALSRANIAAVSPLSTGSPHLQLDLLPGDSLQRAAARIDALSPRARPTVITPEGQCLYLRRWALDAFGFFDSSYGRGFYEESDLCMRMFLYGADTVCADDALIYHQRAASFGSVQKQALIEKNRVLFDARWGAYYKYLYPAFLRSNPLKALRASYASEAPALHPLPCDTSVQELSDTCEQAVLVTDEKTTEMKWLADADVVFILPSVIRGGGTLSVLQHVNELIRNGVRARVLSLTEGASIDYPLLAPVIRASPTDIMRMPWDKQRLVATFWATAYLVEELCKRNPALRGYYYIQDYEPWFYQDAEQSALRQAASRTYEYSLQGVSKTKFLADKVQELHGKSVTLIAPGIDAGIFYPGQQDMHRGRPRMAALFRGTTTRRGGVQLLAMLERLKARFPELAVTLFGDSVGVPEELLPWVSLQGELKPPEVGKLYRSSDIVVDLSQWHGFGRMGIEGICCGAVPVLSDSGGVSRYAAHEKNSLLVPVGDVEAAVDAVIRLSLDKELRLSLRKTGLKGTKAFSEEKASADWMKLFG